MSDYFRAVALDYDGTIALGSRPDDSVLAALRKVRTSARRTLLVTGRILAALEAEFPDGASAASRTGSSSKKRTRSRATRLNARGKHGSLCLVTYHPEWLPMKTADGSDVHITIDEVSRARMRSNNGAGTGRVFRPAKGGSRT